LQGFLRLDGEGVEIHTLPLSQSPRRRV
jgi:hypothetical protein